eukprot:Protomagalhaensia_sp_Gyna_25__6006@NODE_93_length_5325_cov_100_196557_g72_i0_p8_GENE_NODE_93_length_5325_cov_100_196557_g72_i0NODE_93_length_5325_cov_100_196557_g72_i0_p8_ORF_typecomplete_len101_score27_87DUF919/PF06034_11/0_035DUF919/PF06034_11/1_4e03DUF4588/PF15251_6/0_83_NODE_93_length_5325_cov_100_196557_g72_i039534255
MDEDHKKLDPKFSRDVVAWGDMERTETLKAITKDQQEIQKILEAETRAPRNSPTPPELQRMEHTMSEEEMAALQRKADEEAAKVKEAKEVAAHMHEHRQK